MFFSREKASQTPVRPPEPPSNSHPIKATFLRRTATFPWICVKHYDADWLDVSESAAIEYIREHTSVPVPKIYCAFTYRNKTYIAMERIKGTMLADGWLQRSEESRSRILNQLKTMIEEIRSIRSPHGSSVASVDGGSLNDPRLPGIGTIYPTPTARRFGPFEDINAFHRWLRRPHKDADDAFPDEVNEMIKAHEETDWGQPFFTHGDLSSFNIIVKDDKVTGIIDWETAGWYPHYWEYTRASRVSPQNAWWVDYLDRFLEPKPNERKFEETRCEFWGEI
ncbi:kinase-like protein [Aureobasidium pullulans]|uniref:Kinase-like protein n=1 Tax=Aureobasidium pullulans TaxID=5580 RepID=A0AB74J8D3_AURPU|nr:kinase-like protein [Aureobasidium pullulans]THX35348.1 kinase-like protein [Aureobasidium pullulans]THX62586.1 kinase-like protein [Aureobasidium pullulans]